MKKRKDKMRKTKNNLNKYEMVHYLIKLMMMKKMNKIMK